MQNAEEFVVGDDQLDPGSLVDLEQSENCDPGCVLQLLANQTHHHFLQCTYYAKCMHNAQACWLGQGFEI